ncbi:MAG: hypothetical protein LBC99_10810 [Spirochaetota bacterium]|jgi:hypothetical protein|nr:hypothetical protein [Spirochaetota bacterium]
MKRVLYALAGIGLLGVFGCATIISGTTKEIRISSTPADASVVIFDEKNNKVWESGTPVDVKLKRGAAYFRGAKYRVEITKQGYQKQVVLLRSSLNGGWYIVGNILFGGILGWLLVDPASGAMWTLKPADVNAELRQGLSLDDKGNAEGIYVVLKEEIPEDIFNSLNLVRID